MGISKNWVVYLNPEWIATQHPAKIALILVGHELQHALGRHSERLSECRHIMLGSLNLANAAHDLAINCGLQGFVTAAVNQYAATKSDKLKLEVPKEGLYVHQFKTPNGQPFPSGRLSEEYAELLVQLVQKQAPSTGAGGQGEKKEDQSQAGAGPASGDDDGNDGGQEGEDEADGGASSGTGTGQPQSESKSNAKDQNGPPMSGHCGSGAGGPREKWEDPEDEPDPEDFNSGVTEAEQNLVRQQVAQAIIEQAGHNRGTVPGHMTQWAEIYVRPTKTPWQDVLRHSIRAALNRLLGKYDYTYMNPNRRTAGSKVILPGFYKPEPKLIVAIDTSGSMCKKDYACVFGEIAAIFKSLGLRKIPVFACDTEATDVQWVTKLDDIQIAGGGGTDMRKAIRHACDAKLAKLIVVMSDGITPWGDKPNGVDVVACLTREPSTAWPTPKWLKVIVADGATKH